MSNNVIFLYRKNRDMFEQMLLDNLVNPLKLFEQNHDGETVLHHLIGSNDNRCAEKVLKFVNNNLSTTQKQKFIDMQNRFGDTALHLAVRMKDNHLASLLDAMGANKKIPNNKNEIIGNDTDNKDEDEEYDDETDTESVFSDSSIESYCNDEENISKNAKQITRIHKNTETELSPESLDDIVLTEDMHSNMMKIIQISRSNSFSPDSLNELSTSSEFKKKEKTPTKQSGNFITNFLSNIFGQKGGADVNEKTSENLSDSQSTSEFINYINSKISNNLEGGRKKSKSKKSKSKKSDKPKKSHKMSRSASKSEEIHAEVIKMIQDLGYSLEEAKTIKAALYTYTKQKHPELSNYERAVKMRSYTTQQHIANLDIESVKQALEIHYKTKNANK